MASTPPDDNTTIVNMRKSVEDAQKEAKTAKELADKLAKDLEESTRQLKEIELSKLDDVKKLQVQKEDLEKVLLSTQKELDTLKPLQDRSKSQQEFVEKLYESKLEQIEDKDLREKIKLLSFVEGDPINSVTKLDNAMDVLKVGTPPGTTTVVTNPGKTVLDSEGKPKADNKDDKKIDFKNQSWGNALDEHKKIYDQQQVEKAKAAGA